MKRGEQLLAGVRRRLARSNNGKGSARSAVPEPDANGNGNPKPRSKRPKNANEVRIVGKSRFARCPVCRQEFSINMDGRVRAHRDATRKGKCAGSGTKVAKVRKTANGNNSVRTFSGGLPSLGKRR